MFTWNVEEMKLTHSPKLPKLMDGMGAWRLEREVSREDKIRFIDERTDGEITKILELSEKYAKEKEQLPHDEKGHVKTVSLKAWLKRNDTDRLFDADYHIGRTNKHDRHIEDLNTTWNYNEPKDFVDFAFHKELEKCQIEENKYFNTHDEYTVLTDKLAEKLRENNLIHDAVIMGKSIHCSYGSSGNEVTVYGKGQEKRKANIEELETLLDYIEDIEKYIKERTQKLEISYDKPLGIDDKTRSDDAR